MKRVICFCRVSSLQQDLEMQRKEVLKVIKHDGFNTNEIIIIEGKESAIKLDEEERQTLNELKECVNQNSSIKDVYFYAIDRLARRVSIVLSIVDAMTKLGVNLHFLNPYPMQTLRDGKEDSMGKMFLTFLSIGAEMEMKMKKERFISARKIMKEAGKLVTGTVLFGYYRDKNGYPQKKDDEAKAVQMVFDEYIKGVSMRKIAQKMVMKGYFDGSTLKSTNSGIVKVSNIINNPAYSGRTPKQFDSKEEKTIKYPAIVDVETQDAALQRASNNKKLYDTKTIYYAKGLVKMEVGENKFLVLSPIKGNASYGIHFDGYQYNVNINVVDTIAWMVTKRLYKSLKGWEDFQAPFEIDRRIEEYRKQIENLKPIFDKFVERERRLNKIYMLGRLSDDEYEQEHDEIAREKSQYEKEQKKLETMIRRNENDRNEFTNMKERVIDFDNMDDEEKAEICHTILDSIIVEKVGKFEYLITPIPTSTYPLGVATYSYTYNSSGGKQRLYINLNDVEKKDISNEIIKRFKSAVRTKKG